MGELIEYGKKAVEYGNYADFKQTMDSVVEEVEEGFVKIGYLLKVARDTAVLQESGYATVNEFAEKEYGLDKSAVSRFIAINDRFAEGGYAPRLQEQYRGMGRAKLSIMLMLPEWINEEISPDYSKSDIQAIRAEVAEEEKATDLEILMEEREDIYDRLENDLQRVLWKLGQDIPELYCKLWKEYMRADNVEQLAKEVMEIMAPAGEGMHSARISGIGRLMLSLKGADRDLVLINVRSGEKQGYGWDDVEAAFDLLMGSDSAKESWETVYGAEMPGVAPVQPESRKTSRVSPAVTEENNPAAEQDGTNLEKTETEVPEEIGPEQLPHGTSKGDGISWKEPEEKKEFREELPKKDAEYRVPIGSNLLKDIRSGQRFLILRTKDPFCVENIIHLFGQKNGEETGIEIDIQITHLIKDHGGLVPGYVAFQFEVIPAAPGQIPGQMEIGDMEKEEGVEPESGEETDAEAGVHGESAESDT